MGTDDAVDNAVDNGYIMIGRQPENRRQVVAKACWTVLWLTYLFYAVADLMSGRHSTVATALGWGGLVGFVVVYLFLLFGPRPRAHRVPRRQIGLLAGLYAPRRADGVDAGRGMADAAGVRLPSPAR
ncbi:hypothetical protein GCM10020221_20960 [Streptomyces thioluteus]|uniref:Integral membrane protein n=1 Tax=Streptomyces thioluteus TaxID=66431 RepID=A0ABN3WT81_STRTU